MTTVWFVDTSVWCNLLEIPNKSQDVTGARTSLVSKVRAKHQLILPFAAVVETGNFVAQVKDGQQRRSIAKKFANMLNDTAQGKTPWVPNTLFWNSVFLESLVAGLGEGRSLVELAQQQVGLGDLSILIEMKHYQKRTGIDAVLVWTYDATLTAHANSFG